MGPSIPRSGPGVNEDLRRLECGTDGPIGWVVEDRSVPPHPPHGPIGPTLPTKIDRKARIVAGSATRDTGRMNSMATDHGPTEAGHYGGMSGHRHASVDEARWAAVTAHDRAADGTFVYAVRSTGVYCRPSCPSRRPRRERVAFFETPDLARGAGFRACKRCKPDSVAAAADPWVEKIRRACVYLSNVDGHPALATLAQRLGGSPYHLQRNFKRLVGVTPREYAEACRLNTVKRRLRRGTDVTGAMLDAGYGSSSRFYERAVPKLGMAPSVYQRGGAGMTIRYSVVDSPLGKLL